MFKKFLTLVGGKFSFVGTENWFLYLRHQWGTQEISVASGLTLVVTSPVTDGEIIPDGELYIL